MLKNKTALEITMNDRVYSLHVDPASPLGELHDVLSAMKAFVVQKINEANSEKSESSKEASSKDK